MSPRVRERRVAPRWLPARRAVDVAGALLKGWRLTEANPGQPRPAHWSALARTSLPIRQRPELGPLNGNRILNMRRAAAAVHGSVLAPGRVLSVAVWLGNPAQRGYLPAPALSGRGMTPSPGGGLCQVSTVVFMAGLGAGLEVLERHHHSADPWGAQRVLPLGLDAAFAYGVKDLKLRNPYPFPVSVDLQVDDAEAQLSAAFWAPVTALLTSRVTARVLERVDPPAAQDWTCGWVVETRRSVTVSGRSVCTYHAFSRYRPFRLQGTAP